MRDITLGFLYRKTAGLFSIHTRYWSFHLLPRPKSWVWGYAAEDYDQCMDYYGFGPLFLVAVPAWDVDEFEKALEVFREQQSKEHPDG